VYTSESGERYFVANFEGVLMHRRERDGSSDWTTFPESLRQPGGRWTGVDGDEEVEVPPGAEPVALPQGDGDESTVQVFVHPDGTEYWVTNPSEEPRYYMPPGGDDWLPWVKEWDGIGSYHTPEVDDDDDNDDGNADDGGGGGDNDGEGTSDPVLAEA
jgi:hypothetical protein